MCVCVYKFCLAVSAFQTSCCNNITFQGLTLSLTPSSRNQSIFCNTRSHLQMTWDTTDLCDGLYGYSVILGERFGVEENIFRIWGSYICQLMRWDWPFVTSPGPSAAAYYRNTNSLYIFRNTWKRLSHTLAVSVIKVKPKCTRCACVCLCVWRGGS